MSSVNQIACNVRTTWQCEVMLGRSSIDGDTCSTWSSILTK